MPWPSPPCWAISLATTLADVDLAVQSVRTAAVGLALAAGAAGTLAFTGGLAEAVIGVMVAVALVPPLVTAGLLVGAGYTAQAAVIVWGGV